LFASMAAGFRAHDVDGGAMGDDVEPGDERLIAREGVGLPKEIEEDVLGDVFGQVRGTDLTTRGGVYKREVPLDQRGEGTLRAFADITLEEFMIAHEGRLQGSPRGE